jgi:RNA recognition motif-containing protein
MTGRGSGAGRASLKPRRGEDDELSKKIYIGNLPFSSTEDELRAVFERHGNVASVSVITDRDTSRSGGGGGGRDRY